MSVLPSRNLVPIVPFDLIVDTDFGLIKLINERYHNKDTFHSSLLSMSDKNLIYFLYNRKEKNPLITFAKDKNNKDLDEYYKQFMEEEYVDIIKRSCTTAIYNLLVLSLNTEGAISPVILCRSELERNVLFKVDKELAEKSTILIGTYDTIDYHSYDVLYFKDIDEPYSIYRKIEGKNIYIAGYGFNYTYDSDAQIVLKQKQTKLLSTANVIKTTSVYQIDDTFIPKG